MAYFLAKTDPACYSIEDLIRDGETEWDGVHNPQALKAIRAMRPGDLVYIYHSQGEAAIVGLAEVTSEPRPDPNDPRSWVVNVRFRERLGPVTLREIKATGLFDDWSLVRQSRLSTMAVPDAFVEWMNRRCAAQKSTGS